MSSSLMEVGRDMFASEEFHRVKFGSDRFGTI